MLWLIVLICVAADQASKLLVVSNLQLGESLPLIPEVFHLTYILNRGASFSILQGQRWVFIIITVVALVAVLILLRYIPRDFRRLRVLIAVFVGGTLGNFIDRLYLGAVIDFFDFRVFPIFNIADCCITCSVALICLMLLFGREKSLLETSK